MLCHTGLQILFMCSIYYLKCVMGAGKKKKENKLAYYFLF